MKNKFTTKLDNIKIDLKNKFGQEKFRKIYNYYKSEEKVILYFNIKYFQNIQKNDKIMENLEILIRETFSENFQNVNLINLFQFNENFISLVYYEVQLENVNRELK